MVTANIFAALFKKKFIEDCKIKFRRCLVRINDALIFAIRLKKISSL
jgi:hypothetical protein